MKVLGIIPARYASSRLPGKPLADLEGKTMLQRVFERAQRASTPDRLMIATDNEKVAEQAREFAGQDGVIMTNAEHPSGTDRCREVLDQLANDYDVVINIQGDEPFLPPEHIDTIATLFRDPDTGIGTLARTMEDPEEASDPHRVKVVFDRNGNALYFSRSIIPYSKHNETSRFEHIGIYGYRADVLRHITTLPPSSLEKAESLEQLRWLEHGIRIKVGLTEATSLSIDTPEDLEKARKTLKEGGSRT